MLNVWVIEERRKEIGADWQSTNISEVVRQTAREFKRALQKNEGDFFDFRITKYTATKQRG